MPEWCHADPSTVAVQYHRPEAGELPAEAFSSDGPPTNLITGAYSVGWPARG